MPGSTRRHFLALPVLTALGFYGNRQVISPNPDRLAAKGILFRHCISNSRVCSRYEPC